MCKKCYVTTPIYYASGTPQLGNSYSTVACDVFARFNRLMGRDTFYLTGMDEHGQKIEEKANAAGIEPKQYVDNVAAEAKKVWKDLDISYDHFIRTTDDYHVKTVQKIFEQLLKQDDIYLGSYVGNYCVSCETFFTKTQLGENDTCPDCGKPTKKVSEEAYFLRLSKYADKLLAFIKANPDFIVPETRRNEVISFIESGLDDLCVSRTSFKWGIPVLSNPKHVVYVWIDALANYITALGYGSDNEEKFNKYWLAPDARICHVIGKDILRFHAIYWPIMLMALNIPINFQLIVHGWILNRDGKMSKSRGNAVYPGDLYSRYGSDSVRYYLTKEMPLGNDGLFSYDRFIERYNNELVNDYGNLVSRTLSMLEKYFDGIVPSTYKETAFDSSLEEIMASSISETIKCFDQFELQNAINATWTLVKRANKYIDETTPWVLAKDDNKKDELASVLYHLVESIRIISILTSPYLVKTSKIVIEHLGISDARFINLKFGHNYNNAKLNKVEHLFDRLDPAKELAILEKPKEEVKEVKTEKMPEISIDDFAKVELKVGVVLESKKHENADKLLVSKIQIGDEVRQIVSGIAKYYDPADFVGKKVIVVTNLKKAVIRGVESNGMVLCAADDNSLEIVTVKDAVSGTKVR